MGGMSMKHLWKRKEMCGQAFREKHYGKMYIEVNEQS